VKHTPWSAADIAVLRERYPHQRAADLAALLKRSVSQIYAKAKKLGIGKTAAYLASPAACRLRRGDGVGQAYRFPPGHVPANKGKRGQPSVGRMAETQFKQGENPRNWLPIGSARVSDDGYHQVKLTDTGYPPRDWVGVHHLVWELTHGPIPKAHHGAFKDGNKSHIAIDNLELVSFADMMRRNTRHNLPKEIADTIALRGALNRKINRLTRNHDEQRDDR
jgi:hypothetical protein